MALATKRNDIEEVTAYNQNDNQPTISADKPTILEDESLRDGYIHYWLSQNNDLESA